LIRILLSRLSHIQVSEKTPKSNNSEDCDMTSTTELGYEKLPAKWQDRVMRA